MNTNLKYAGYVRLSRDDGQKHYVSIENQKLIISQYAAQQGMVIDRWYEDDGFSGYTMERPAFCRLIADLSVDVGTVLVKDFSRLGRHNARVLLLLDEFLEKGKRLIAIDDGYDSLNPEDDIIGIKTWYNERYVKDTSRKIRRAIQARQQAGTMRTSPPYGYCAKVPYTSSLSASNGQGLLMRTASPAAALDIVPEEADCIRSIYELYLGGFGYRRIAARLNSAHIPTPSMARRSKALAEGKLTKWPAAAEWSDGMVKELLSNDFYTGTLRLHKRARASIHGRDQRIPAAGQYVFPDHHPPIIDQTTFRLVQQLRAEHAAGRSPFVPATSPASARMHSPAQAPFSGLLFCQNCQSRLTPIVRQGGHSGSNSLGDQSPGSSRTYYLCSSYNRKGKQGCSSSHTIRADDLTRCLDAYWELLDAWGIRLLSPVSDIPSPGALSSKDTTAARKGKRLDGYKRQLQSLIAQQAQDLSRYPDSRQLVEASYGQLISKLLEQIHQIESQSLSDSPADTPSAGSSAADSPAPRDSASTADAGGPSRHPPSPWEKPEYIRVLVRRITADASGHLLISLNGRSPDVAGLRPSALMNQGTHKVICAVLTAIAGSQEGFVSARGIAAALAASDPDISYTKSTVLPYIRLMISLGILAPTGQRRTPYQVIVTQEYLSKVSSYFEEGWSAKGLLGGMSATSSGDLGARN